MWLSHQPLVEWLRYTHPPFSLSVPAYIDRDLLLLKSPNILLRSGRKNWFNVTHSCWIHTDLMFALATVNWQALFNVQLKSLFAKRRSLMHSITIKSQMQIWWNPFKHPFSLSVSAGIVKSLLKQFHSSLIKSARIKSLMLLHLATVRLKAMNESVFFFHLLLNNCRLKEKLLLIKTKREGGMRKT